MADIGPVKAIARRQKPLLNLHSLVHVEKQLLTELIEDLRCEVKISYVLLSVAGVAAWRNG